MLNLIPFWTRAAVTLPRFGRIPGEGKGELQKLPRGKGDYGIDGFKGSFGRNLWLNPHPSLVDVRFFESVNFQLKYWLGITKWTAEGSRQNFFFMFCLVFKRVYSVCLLEYGNPFATKPISGLVGLVDEAEPKQNCQVTHWREFTQIYVVSPQNHKRLRKRQPFSP